MLRLDFISAPVWIDMIGDARVSVVPFTTTVLARARAIMRRPDDDLPDETDEAQEEHFQRFTVAVASVAIREFENIADMDGNPLPVTAETVAGLLSIPACAEAFKIGYMVPAMAVLAEKKDLPPSQNGTSGAVRIIAVPAARPAKSAPTL